MDHRRLQRTLFRMLHDAGFAARLRAGDAQAAASTGLGAAELALLRDADPEALAVDRDGRRTTQLIESVSSEYALSTHPAIARTLPPDWPRGFASSPELHEAVSSDASFGIAFGAFALRRAREAGSVAVGALAALERELARARRQPERAVAVPPGCLLRAPDAILLALPAGTFALAASLRAALDAGTAASPSALRGLAPGATETVLVQALARPHAHALREVRAERLEPLVAEFLRSAERPLDAAARAAFAAAHDADPADVERVAEEFAAEGVLLRG